MPLRLKVGKLYWWKAKEEVRILVRCVAETEQYVSVRVQAITAEQVLAIDRDPQMLLHLDKRSAPLEDVTP